MPLTNLARDIICDRLIGGGTYNAFDATNGHLGVGDSNTAFAASQTDLQAATNKHREILDGAPQRTANAVTFVATFETGDANFAWAEWGIFNHASAGQMLSRKVESLGTKTSAAAWELTVTVTITLA